MAKKIVCRHCAAEFDEMLPKCPYCDSTNYKGAEAEYLNKLEDVREDMEDLEEVPMEETKKEIRKQGHFLRKVFLVIGGLFLILAVWVIWSERRYDRDEKADYLWKQENLPAFDRLYDEQKYEELIKRYADAYNEDKPVFEWEHSDFCEIYDSIISLQNMYEREAAGKALSEVDYALILNDEWKVLGMSFRALDDEEEARLAEYAAPVQKAFEQRWNMSKEEYDSFYEQLEDNGGWVPYTDCQAYVKEWLSAQ